MVMDINEIREYLPHRYPFLLIDRVTELSLGESIVAYKNVSINEPFFNGHFPHYPVMPGVLILEALAQAAAIMSFMGEGAKPEDNMVYYFAGIEGARFRRPVVPGDQLRLEVKMGRAMRGVGKYHGKAYVGDSIAAEADLMCAMRKLEG